MKVLQKFFIILICLGIIIIRMIYPDLNFDWISLSLVLVIALLTFSSDMEDYTKRIKKLKLGDIEIELGERIKKLAEKTDKTLENKSEKINSSPNVSGHPWLKKKKENSRTEIYKVIDKPEAALILIAIEIEKELRAIYSKANFQDEKMPTYSKKLIHLLHKQKIVDAETLNVFEQFWMLRNKIIHGHAANISEKKKLEMVEIGLKLLQLLEIINRNLAPPTTKIVEVG